MTVHSHQKKRRRESNMRFKTVGSHEEFLERITKSLYYSELPTTERFSFPLSELAVELYSEVKRGRSLDRLRLEEAAEISRNACISPCSLVLALIYLEQLNASNPLYVDNVTSSDLFIISLMVASKFLNDSGEEDDVMNSEWAVSAGLSLSDLNKLEIDFLTAIDWKIYVNDDSFWEKLSELEETLALREGKKRGWFSYTELNSLLHQINATLLAQTVFTVSAVCLASYAAGMLTVIGSTMAAARLVSFATSVSPSGSPASPSPSPSLLVLNHSAGRPHLSEPVSIHDLPPSVLDLHLIPEDALLDRSIYGEDDNTLHDCPDTLEKENLAVENISYFYKKFLAPISYNLMNFHQTWATPPVYIFSK